MIKHKKFIIGAIVLLVAIFVLGYAAFMVGGTYYYEVGEFLDKADTVAGQIVRVNGTVAPDAAKDGFTWHFTLLDMTGRDAKLTVVYDGSVPDTFKVGRQIVVEGRLQPLSGIFEASNIIIKCSSKFEPATQ